MKVTFRNTLWAAGFPGFLLIFRDILSFFTRRVRDIDQAATLDTSAGIQLMYIFLIFTVGLWHYLNSKNTKKIINESPIKYLIIYHILALVSAVWSINSGLSFIRAFEAIAYILLISSVFSYLINRYSAYNILRWVLFYAVIAIFFSVLARARLLGIGIFSFDIFLTEQFNSTAYFYLALLFPISMIVKSIILSISLLSLSNTAYLGIALGLIGLSYGAKKQRLMFYIIIVTIVSFISIFGIESVLKSSVFFGREEIGIEHTSGRDRIIELTFESIKQKPLLGYGFVAGELFIIGERFDRVIGAHNGLASALIGIGIIGGIIFITFLLNTFLTVVKTKYLNSYYKSMFLATLILVTVHSMGNPGIGSRVYGTWIPSVVVITCMLSVILKNKNNISNEYNVGNKKLS